MAHFRLQQFSLQQDRSAMKVCGDSLLFGASLPIQGGESVIDIGAGTGILSLMAMQQGAAKVTAIEIASEAAEECRENFAGSPWAKDLECITSDIQGYPLNRRFDLVISNPPFFANQQRSQQGARRTARHTDTLPFDQLLDAADQLMHEDGRLCLLIPHYETDNITALCRQRSLFLERQITIRGRTELAAKVVVLWFQRQQQPRQQQSITMYDQDGEYTAQSRHYLQHYLLKFGDH